jgi:hypothetical protein
MSCCIRRGRRRLSPEDRNLTTALVMGVLRWQIALDARVRGLLQRPEQRLAEPVAIALRMGRFNCCIWIGFRRMRR